MASNSSNFLRSVARVAGAGLVFAFTTAYSAACTISSDKSSSDGDNPSLKVSVATGGSASADVPALGPDDVRITSTDNVLVMSLIGDTVRMQLSDSLRNAVAADIQKDGANSDDKSGIAAMVTKSVAGVVKTAMGFTVKAAAKDVKNLRYENGHILFEIANTNSKVSTGHDNRNEKATFNEADAKKFIDAVNKKAAGAVAM